MQFKYLKTNLKIMQQEAYEVFNAERLSMEERCKADHELELKCERSRVAWCPSHDIVAIYSQVSHLLEVYRIEAELERVVSA